MRGRATRLVWHIPSPPDLRSHVEHGQHRTPSPPSRRRMALAVGMGALMGGAGVAAAWSISEASSPEPEARSVVRATPSPPRSSQRQARALSAESRDRRPTDMPVFPRTSPVLLLGDSLAVGIGGYVDSGLGDRPLTIDAAEGRGTSTSVSLLAPNATTAPMTWVVSLGTNDNTEEFPANAAALMELAGEERCVVWFDVWRLDTGAAINAALDELAASHPNMHLIRWNDVSLQHPEWFSGSDVHPSSEGYAVRGQLAVDAVDQICTSAPSVTSTP